MGGKDFKTGNRISLLISKGSGMTLIEVLIVLAIVAIMILLVIFSLNPKNQTAKANDSKRKSDLKRISTALEDYAGDHPCYPLSIYQGTTCTPSSEIDPYLKHIPCDPKTGRQYPYIRPDGCSQYAVYATLELENVYSFGPGNYVLTSSNLRIIPAVSPSPTPVAGSPATTAPLPISPTPATEGIFYGCFSGICLPISGPEQCPEINYRLSDCRGQCVNPINECR